MQWSSVATLRVEVRSLERILVPALLVVLVAASAWVILAHPKVPIWDQQALLEARFEGPVIPSPARGFTSQLVVALTRAVSPWGDVQLHEHVRVLAMAFYCGAATLLAGAMLRRASLLAGFLALLFTSQYPFLWLSSELITGGFLCLALAARVLGLPAWSVGTLLALLGLCKPDVMLVSLVLLVFWVARGADRRDSATLVAGFALTLLALLLPGVAFHGLDYFHTYGTGPGGRSFASFGQHYAALVAPLQVAPGAPDPWAHPEVYVERAFPGAATMSDVILGGGVRYLEFVALSFVRGLRKTGYTLHYLMLAIPALVWAWRRGGFALTDAERALWLTLVGFVPFVLLAYPHIRYLARYYPLCLILVFAALERVLAMEDRTVRGPCLVATGLCVLFALAENVERASVGLARAGHLQQYWFSD